MNSLHKRMFKCSLQWRDSFRSSLSEVFLEKAVLKICSKFTGEHPCRSVISIKLQSNLIEITLRHGCSAVNLPHVFRTLFTKNGKRFTTSWWLLLLLLIRIIGKSFFFFNPAPKFAIFIYVDINLLDSNELFSELFPLRQPLR